MKRKSIGTVNRILAYAAAVMILAGSCNFILTARATTIKDVENQMKSTQQLINEINDKISSLSDEQSILNEMIDDLNAEIINTMTSIELKEDEISEKEEEIEETKADIDQVQKEYEAAKATEEKQYNDMVNQLRYMYENGEVSYTSLLMSGSGLGDALNKMDCMEAVYEYSRMKLLEYEAAKNQTIELMNILEDAEQVLETQMAQLEADREYLQALKDELDVNLEKKKKESDNYEAEIKKARQEATIAKTQLQKEQQTLKKLQAEEAARQAAAAAAARAAANASATYATTDYTQIIDSSAGSDLGKQIAKYACQYIGNPYVWGGTSLTKGADCSGFVYRVYGDFNYSLPRTSFEQRSAGKAVSYSDAQPGDLICYDGHVALYIGQGFIVHASDSRTGIIVGKATYRTILSVRRII